MEFQSTPVVIFAGGVGSRLGEHTATVPKPLVTVGGVPILYRIMEQYSRYGFNEFIVLGGYLFDVMRTRLLVDSMGMGDLQFDFSSRSVSPISESANRDWRVQLIDTGADSETGLRLSLAQKHLASSGTFFLTYGDGLSDIDFRNQLKQHLSSNKIATVSAVRSPSKYGHLEISDSGEVTQFVEKPQDHGPWINGGFFVMQGEVFDHLSKDQNVPLEHGLLPNLARLRQLNVFKHSGFWKSMDSPKDKAELDALAKSMSLPGQSKNYG